MSMVDLLWCNTFPSAEIAQYARNDMYKITSIKLITFNLSFSQIRSIVDEHVLQWNESVRTLEVSTDIVRTTNVGYNPTQTVTHLSFHEKEKERERLFQYYRRKNDSITQSLNQSQFDDFDDNFDGELIKKDDKFINFDDDLGNIDGELRNSNDNSTERGHIEGEVI